MCRVLAYIGPETPIGSLLLKPDNSLINQTLDPELHPLLQLARWGFGAWSEHLLKPDEPFLYRRPMAATQMRGITDTELLYVLLLSLLEGDGDDDVQRGFEEMLKVIAQAMKTLDLGALTKLKMALVVPDRIIGINSGLGHQGEVDVTGDWRELRKSGPGTDDHALSMLLEPMYMLVGKNLQDDEDSDDIDVCADDEATSVLFASEPLTEDTDDWLCLEFGEMVAIERNDSGITRKVTTLNL